VRFGSVSQKDNAYHKAYLSSFDVMIPLYDLSEDFFCFQGKYMLEFSWKKQLNFFIKPFLFVYCVCAEGSVFSLKGVLSMQHCS